jgi:paraquat-inducible protein A
MLLVIALGLFIAGVLTPVMTITKLILLESSFSIISGLTDLLKQQQYILFIIITLLSLVLPLFKIILLAWVLHKKCKVTKLQSTIKLIHDYGRWAMLDVLVIALLLVAIKLGAIASVEVHMGLYWFATAVLITMWGTHRTVILIQTPH